MRRISFEALLISAVIILGTGGIVFWVQTLPHMSEVLGTSQHPTAQAPSTGLTRTGQGSGVTPPFSTQGDWNLFWTYDCSKTGHKGKFEVIVFYTDGAIADSQSASVNEFGIKDSGTEQYRESGSYYLAIDSTCSWTVSVKR